MNFRFNAFFIIFLFTSLSVSFAQKGGTSIKFDIKNYDNDTLLIGYYYGDRTLVLDTLIASKKGKFELVRDEMLPMGVYLALYQPSNEYFQFMVNDVDQEFNLKGEKSSPNLVPSGSEDNELFYMYLQFIREKSEIRQNLMNEMDTLKAQGKDFVKLEEKAAKLDEEVQAKQTSIVEKYPKTMTARLISSNFSVDIPEFEGNETDQNVQKYLFFRSHYFDHIDLGDPANLRSPFLHDRIDYFINKLTPQNPDSISIAIDYLLKKMEPAEETYQFYTSYFLNKYANSNIIGFDAIYVHMVDKYYAVGKAPWVSEENLKKFIENADKLRPILIGEQAPPITFFDKDGKPVKLYDIDSKYTVMIFWAPDCGHCKKAIPGLKEFYAKYKDQGVEILGICTKHRDKYSKCWEFVEEKELPWISVGDEFHRSRFRDIYNVVSTPRVFILDENKKILLKRVPTENLDEIMQALIIDLENIIIKE